MPRTRHACLVRTPDGHEHPVVIVSDLSVLRLHCRERWLVPQIAKEIDDERNGFLSERDFASWMKPTGTGQGSTARELRLLRPRRGLSRAPSHWSPEVLRRELQMMLIQAGLAPIDLMKACESPRPIVGNPGRSPLSTLPGLSPFFDLCCARGMVAPQGIRTWEESSSAPNLFLT